MMAFPHKIALSMCLLVNGTLCAGWALDLMPMPAKVSPGQGGLAIDATFTIAISGCSSRRLEAAARRLVSRISRQTGIPLADSLSKGPATLAIECQAASPEVPALGENESYGLQISSSGARLRAPAETGVLRGLATFAQLVTANAESFAVPAADIEDKPRFPWRGLMMDVSRHWMPLTVIERNLDAMAAVKLNVFHWHLSDDQGFRIESRIFPKLHELGSDGHFYTQDEARHIVAYAADRGIRVIPEFDIPGHTTSWFVAYPELASAPGPYRIERKWGIFEPTMDPTREEVYAFLEKFIGEMTQIFPDLFFHIGGDEVLDHQWNRNPAIQAFAREHGFKASHDLHTYFNTRLLAILQKHGRRMIGWDEILQPGLPADSIIQSWRGQKSLAEAARKGYRGLLSFGYYLDHMDTSAQHYANDPLEGETKDLNREEAARILGGEVCMWAEYVTPEIVDSRIWPRTAAIAERLWSPADLKDTVSMYARMEAVSRKLDWVGVTHRSHYARQLERLAAGHSERAVRVLADAVEPLGIDAREKARSYGSQTPLNRLVDVARPESEHVRAVEAAAKEYNVRRAELRRALTEWRDNHELLLPLLESSFLLRETSELSKALAEAGSIGLQALEYLERGAKPPQDWTHETTGTLTRLEAPKAEARLAAVRPVRMLVEAATRAH